MKFQAIRNSKHWCHVNRQLLPFKLHFFFICGAWAVVLPFMPIIAKEIGINATAVGIGYSMVPIFTILSHPIIGFLVDYFKNIKVFLIALLITSCFAFSAVLSLPPITPATEDLAYVQVSHHNDSQSLMNISMSYERSCLEEVLKKEIQCELGFEHQTTNSHNNTSSINVTHVVNDSLAFHKGEQNKYWITFYIEDIPLPEMKDQLNALKFLQCSPNIHQCSVSTDFDSVFSTYQFWAFFTFIVIGAITSSSGMDLTSVACNEILGDQIGSYGRQRLFGTISWGIICSLAGILNDTWTSTDKNFLSGLYLMAAFMTIDTIILCVIRFPKAHMSSDICTNLCKIFSSKEILVFAMGVAFVGFLTSIICVYEFWFLEDMGASRTLLGLSVSMQCLLGEVPFLFFSGWFVNKLGHFLCMVGVFAGFAVRLLLYSFLKDPWLALPIDILHGLTFGLYHGAMVSFAKVKAPKGMEATVLGLFGGLYDGLGHGFGSFMGGFGVDKLGPRKTFFAASMISFICLLLFLMASYVFRTPQNRKVAQMSSLEMEEMVQN